MSHPFERPVFIVAAPRSCSTLLFQTLARSSTLWTLGDESHAIFEGHRKLSPVRGAVDSNRVTAEMLDPALARSIPSLFARQVHDCKGRPLTAAAGARLLEKTPKNSLRVPFLDALFPDALFIVLVRDARANIASIIEAWGSGRFVTYPMIRTAHGPWSLLLPPGWRGMTARPLEEIATFQWCAANRHIVEDLGRIERSRWTALSAEELVQDPPATVARLCAFMGIELDAGLRESLDAPLPHSQYTVSAPAADKWRAHAGALERVWPRVQETITQLNRFLDGIVAPLASEVFAGDSAAEPDRQAGALQDAPVSRNQPCPCGSGRRYKACHGSLAAAAATRGEA